MGEKSAHDDDEEAHSGPDPHEPRALISLAMIATPAAKSSTGVTTTANHVDMRAVRRNASSQSAPPSTTIRKTRTSVPTEPANTSNQ